jgi:hypothetical protein
MRTNEGPLGPDCTSKTAPYGWPINESSQHFMFPIFTLLFPNKYTSFRTLLLPLVHSKQKKGRVHPFQNSQLKIIIYNPKTKILNAHPLRLTHTKDNPTSQHEKESKCTRKKESTKDSRIFVEMCKCKLIPIVNVQQHSATRCDQNVVFVHIVIASTPFCCCHCNNNGIHSSQILNPLSP